VRGLYIGRVGFSTSGF